MTWCKYMKVKLSHIVTGVFMCNTESNKWIVVGDVFFCSLNLRTQTQYIPILKLWR